MRCYHNKAPSGCSVCQRDDRAAGIKAVLRLIRRKPRSASELAAILGVSKPTIYKRLEHAALAADLDVRIEHYGERGRGPRAKIYSLKKGLPSGRGKAR